MKKLLFSSVALTLFASSALAGATLSDMHGKVLVNTGVGFVSPAGSMDLKAGDKVMIGEESFAVLSYKECAVSLDKPTIVTVTEEGSCEASGVVVTPTADVVDEPHVIPPVWWLVGGAAIAGGIWYYKEFSDDDDDPTSPNGGDGDVDGDIPD